MPAALQPENQLLFVPSVNRKSNFDKGAGFSAFSAKFPLPIVAAFFR